MPNWCNCTMTLSLPEKYYDDFLELFGEYPTSYNASKKKIDKFRRSYIDYDDYFDLDSENDVPMIQINMDFNCAWSFWSSLIDLDNRQNEFCNFISIFDAIKKFSIKEITMNSYEYGMLFEEEFRYDSNTDKATYKSFTMPQYQNSIDETEIEFNEDNISTFYTEAFVLYPKIKKLSGRDLCEVIEFLDVKCKSRMKKVVIQDKNIREGDLVE